MSYTLKGYLDRFSRFAGLMNVTIRHKDIFTLSMPDCSLWTLDFLY